LAISKFPASERIRVVLTSRAIVSYVSVWRATARALAELGAPAFFIAGVAWTALGSAAPWFVLAAVGLGVMLRAADIEARALFVLGGLYGSVRETLGLLAARASAAGLLVDRLVLGTLAAVVSGHYLATLGPALVGAPTGTMAGDSAPLVIAAALIALVWWTQRQGRSPADRTVAQLVGGAAAVLGVLVLWAAVSVVVRSAPAAGLSPSIPAPPPGPLTRTLAGWPMPIVSAVLLVVAFGYALPAIGGVDVLGSAALDLEQPRIRNLQRVARLVSAYALVVTATLTFLAVALVPGSELSRWTSAPLTAIALHVTAPSGLRLALLIAVTLASAVFLAATVRSTSTAAHGVLARLVDEGVLPDQWRKLHPRFGTPFRLIDATAVTQLAAVFISGGEIAWLARVYAIGVLVSAVLKLAALVRYRFLRPGQRAYKMPLTIRVRGAEWPIGLLIAGALLAIGAIGLLVAVDAPSLAGALLVVTLTAALSVSARAVAAQPAADGATLDPFQLLPSDEVDLRQVEARPGNLLVPVRKPYTLTHLTAAIRAAGDRDVVAMTVRLVGVDVPDDPALDPRATDEERHLFSAVIAAAEREGRAVRLMIVPGVNVFESVVDTAIRLESAEIHVGESETLSADDQARLLGDAWERAPKPLALDIRLVVHHPRGTTAAYHLGAHAPALRPEDFEQIHRLWLDVGRAVGPRVHHRDVVRAALIHMEQQLNGPNRDDVLQIVRETVRPADEVAALIRDRDFGGLRDMLRNRPASDLASVLTDLSLEEQVLVFRILPRKNAAATFAYLSLDEQNALLKAMASEEAAALLNDMAPDDRTTFLEELPAEATRKLLALLTPEERAEAVLLLGYPEGSIGRLMTPHYVAVREQWTIAQVLEYVRTHGQDSETLNVIYVIDDSGALIDDIRIREFLLTPPDKTVSSLMDRRFVALKATDDQETAVRVFRAEDRVALPVTDTAGALIGIVTVDDVLDVAEREATEDIQRVGGSEALDEPYMQIAFRRMVQKRAGWLTALFLGEMLTATAMGFFEHEIERAVVLALFVPLIISSGGNSGSQASTLVIRALALGEVTLGDWWRVMRREIGAGLTLGGILGTIGFLRITIWSAFSPLYGPHWLLVAVTVSLALVGVVLWGTLIGSLLPFGLRRLGFDPAASSAPFVATLVDVTGLVIYFSVGIVVLRGTLL
jgi:magnesium transporter